MQIANKVVTSRKKVFCHAEIICIEMASKPMKGQLAVVCITKTKISLS